MKINFLKSKIAVLVIVFIVTNKLFSQSKIDTFYLDNKYQKGALKLADSVVGLMNTFFFYSETFSEPITGIVKIKGKKQISYFNVVNGIALNAVMFRNKKYIYDYYYDTEFLSVEYVKNKLKSIYLAKIIDGKLIFLNIRLKNKKYYLKQTFFNKKDELQMQKMKIKSLSLLYNLPALIPFSELEKLKIKPVRSDM